MFKDSKELMMSPCQTFKIKTNVVFYGCYEKLEDPLISNKEQVQIKAYKIGKVSGYQFQFAGHVTSLFSVTDHRIV